MPILSRKYIKELEQWGPSLFYIAGTLLILNLINMLVMLLGINLRLLPYMNFVALGDIIAIAGILSFYPQLSIESPGISFTGAIFLGLAGFCFFVDQIVILGNNLFQLPGFVIPTYFIWMKPLTYTAGFLLFGVATLRTDSYPNLLGFTLLMSAALITLVVILFLWRGLVNTPIWVTQLIVGSQALVYFAIGYILQNKNALSEAEIAML